MHVFNALRTGFITPAPTRGLTRTRGLLTSPTIRPISTRRLPQVPARQVQTKMQGEIAKPAQTDTLKLLYDSECPLCMREINMLRRRNADFGERLSFVDVASDEYDAQDNMGLTYETAMGEMHAITSDGKVVTGVPVFQMAYERVGLGWVYAIVNVPGVGAVADYVYAVWARNRLRVTGRPELEEVVRIREKRLCGKK